MQHDRLRFIFLVKVPDLFHQAPHIALSLIVLP
jgi:hypothetical protein